MNSNNNQDFIEKLRRGDLKVYTKLYHENLPIITNHILKNSGSALDGEDIFQEAMVILYRMVNKDDFKLTSKISTLIFSISRFIWLKRLRDNPNKEVTFLGDEVFKDNEADIEKTYIQNERYKLYREKFKLIPGDCQKILEMSFLKVKQAEIAQKMKLSPSYIKKRKHICIKKLLTIIKDDELFDELN